MNRSTQVMEWFRDEPLPGIVPDTAIIVGGTILLSEFLAIPSSTTTGGQLSIAVPFVHEDVLDSCSVWARMPHASIDLVLVTCRSVDARRAVEAISAFAWRSLVVRFRRRLHAKMYCFLAPSGGGACLIGSHNLTGGGTQQNHEAGVLFVARSGAVIGEIVRACHERIARLNDASEKAIDTNHWPARLNGVAARRSA